MANWISWLLGKGDKGIVEQVADGVGQFIYTGSEKAADKAEFEREITKRWVADSEAPITRLTRPFLVLFVTLAVFIFGALDSSLEGFTISDGYLEMYKEVWIVMIISYFGSRGLEKIKAKK